LAVILLYLAFPLAWWQRTSNPLRQDYAAIDYAGLGRKIDVQNEQGGAAFS